jgi:hypothetical protein
VGQHPAEDAPKFFADVLSVILAAPTGWIAGNPDEFAHQTGKFQERVEFQSARGDVEPIGDCEGCI